MRWIFQRLIQIKYSLEVNETYLLFLEISEMDFSETHSDKIYLEVNETYILFLEISEMDFSETLSDKKKSIS